MSKPINPIALAPELTLRYIAEVAQRLRDVQTGNISFDGDFNLNVIEITSDYTADNETVIICDASLGNFTVNLPSVNDSEDRIYYIKKIDGYNSVVTLQPNGSETIDGTTSRQMIDENSTFVIIATKHEWNVLSYYSGIESGSGVTNGVADYNDTSTLSTPLTLNAGVWTTVPNNGSGASSNTSNLPSGVTQLMDTSNGSFDFSELNFGDNVFIRNDYTVTPSTNNSLLELRYQLGAGANVYTLEKIVSRLDTGSGVGYRFSLTPDMIYVGDSNTRDNPIVLQVKLSTDGTLVNAGSAIGVTKK